MQLPQRAKGLLMDLGDLIVYQDQGVEVLEAFEVILAKLRNVIVLQASSVVSGEISLGTVFRPKSEH